MDCYKKLVKLATVRSSSLTLNVWYVFVLAKKTKTPYKKTITLKGAFIAPFSFLVGCFMFKKTIIVITLLITLAVVSFHFIFVIPNKPNLITSSPNTSNDIYSCYQNSEPKALDVSDGLSLTVWNIYKQNRSHWQTELNKLTAGSDLVLLQEVSRFYSSNN